MIFNTAAQRIVDLSANTDGLQPTNRMSGNDKDLVGLVQNSKLPMWIFDQKTLAFLEVNEAAVQQYGYSRKEFLGLTVLDIRPKADIPRFLSVVVRDHHSSIVPEQWIHLRKDNTVMQVQVQRVEVKFRGKQAELVRVHSLEKTTADTPSPLLRSRSNDID